MRESINICLACDDNYSKYAGVVITSILANATPNDELAFFILDGGISEKRKNEIYSLKSIKDCEINFINVDESLFEEYKNVKSHKYITLATYYRLKLPSLLPDIKRVIYLDCDMIINSSLNDLFNKDLGDSPLAGVSDIKKKRVKANPTYVNAGMLVMDLDNMRKLNLENRFLEWTKEHIETIKVGDQEIINEVCKGNILVIEDEWNVQSSNFTNRSSYTRNPKIVHFTAKLKPWHYASFSFHRDLYFKYLQMTPWKLSDEEFKHWTIDNQRDSIIAYLKYRPLFWIRPSFYRALWCSFITPILEHILSKSEYNKTHNIIKLLGFKIKYPKRNYLILRNKNPYYYYKKNNLDITTIPPATGQIRDIQLANLALFKEFDYVCKVNNIEYWLEGGSLIGLIRHKGFIPWDDDIDVGIIRKDYEKLIRVFDDTVRNPDLYLNYFYNPNTQNLFLKVKHKKCNYLFIDIFPWEIYNKKLTIKEQLVETKNIKNIRKNLIDKKIKNQYKTKQQLEKIMKTQILKYKNDKKVKDSDLIWGIDFPHGEDNWFTSNDVIYPTKRIFFENIEISCMNKPEIFLERVYGNYMAYPEKIGFGHNAYVPLNNLDKEVIEELKASLYE